MRPWPVVIGRRDVGELDVGWLEGLVGAGRVDQEVCKGLGTVVEDEVLEGLERGRSR